MSAIRKSAQTLVAHLLVFAQSLVLTPIVIKVAGTEMFGGYVLLISYLGILFVISSMGVGAGAKRRLPSTIRKCDRATLFFPQFWFQVLSVIALGILSASAYALVPDSVRAQFPGFSGWLIPAYLLSYALFSQCADYFRYTHCIGVFNIAVVFQPYMFVLLAVSTYFLTGQLNTGSLVASLIGASTLVAGVLLLRLYREIGLQLYTCNWTELREEIRLGFPLILFVLIDTVNSIGDRYVIWIMLSVRDVGVYAPAYALGSLTMVLPKVYGVLLPPLLSQRVDTADIVGARKLLAGAVRIFLLFSIPYVMGAAILGKDVLRLYANEDVAQAAWPVIPIVALASVFYGLLLVKVNILLVRLRTNSLFKINAFSAALNIGLNFLLLKLFGDVVMAAVATLVSYCLSYFIVANKITEDETDFAFDKGWLLRIFLASCGMAVALLGLIGTTPDHGGPDALLWGVLVGLVTYALLLLVQQSVRAEIVLFANTLWHR